MQKNPKKTINIWVGNVDNTVISNLTEAKINSKYLSRYWDKLIGPLVSILTKMNCFVKTFQEKNNKLAVSKLW